MFEHFLSLYLNNWLVVIATLVIVMFILNWATWILEEQLSVIWRKLRIPGSVRWATFDAVSSSLPEFLTAMVWLIILGNWWLEVGIGTIGGSAIFNILIIPAVVLLVYTGKKIKKLDISWIRRDTIFYLISILIFLAWLYYKQLTLMSIVLIILYIFYVFYLYNASLKHRKLNFEEVEKAFNSVKDKKVLYLNILISLILIYIWVEVAVVSATWIWKQLNIPILIISLVLLAAITSIPDTLLSAKASKNWDPDAWLSNAVGSNIFDICIWLWFPILIWTTIMWLNPKVDFNSQIWIFWFLFLSTIIYYVLLSRKEIYKWYWIILLITYIGFIAYLYTKI
jgi:cation:H+ antiporter